MKKENRLYNFRLFFLILIAIFLQVFNFELKEIYHIDELFSYGLANGENGVYLFKDASEIDNKLLKGDVFENYLTQRGNTSFSKMWDNLKYDNHMPLFFVLLRTINSFFPPIFTPYPGIISNVIILFILLLSFYKFSNFIFKDKEIALASTALLAFMDSVLFLEIFIRMYLLQMMFSLLLFYKTSSLLLDNKIIKNRYFALICLLSTCTILTHYYSIIYCFILTISSSIIFLYHKKYSILLKYLLTMLCSVIFAYLIYPEMIEVGLYGERGGQFVALLEKYKQTPCVILQEHISLFIKTFFINYYIALVILLLISLIFMLSIKKKLITNDEKDIILLSFLTFVGYGITSSLIMPNMTSYQIRYFSPIIPLEVLLIIIFSILFIRILKSKKIYIYSFLWFVVGVNGYYIATHQNDAFYLRGNYKSRRTEKITKNAEIWWGLGGGNAHSWIIHNYLDKLITVDKVWTLVDFNHPEFLSLAQKGKDEKKYAYLFMPKTQEKLPEGAEEWIRNTTGRQGYYMYTLKSEKTAAMAFEASVFLVCPY